MKYHNVKTFYYAWMIDSIKRYVSVNKVNTRAAKTKHIEDDMCHKYSICYDYFFSFLSASLGHSVLSVEPNINDVYRFHKAAKLGRYERWITLLNNQVGASRDPVTIVQDKPQVNLPYLHHGWNSGNACPQPGSAVTLLQASFNIHVNWIPCQL